MKNKMTIIKTVNEMSTLSDSLKRSDKKIGCVPTMGYLHDGHLALIDAAINQSDVVIATLFVNPAQFSPTEDLNKYPRNLERDIELLEKHGCHYLFSPDEKSMYPQDFSTYVEEQGISAKFEGQFRPVHFKGVITIVAKLFNIIKPDLAFFGQKDYQQTLVIKKMVTDLDYPIKVIVVPTVREKDGLAMSSRNVYLSEKERLLAPGIYQALINTMEFIEQGNRERIKINTNLNKLLNFVNGISIDYAMSARADNLEEPDYFSSGDDVVLLVAARIGTTRLIDNLLIKK